jgi:DNA repair protein radA
MIGISRQAVPEALAKVKNSNEERVDSGIGEINRLLGGGMVPGSLILLGGEPGIGKSTLALQLALSPTLGKVLYVSGEESANQVKMRADRLGFRGQECYILNENLLENILVQAEALEPSVLVVDSIQTVYTETSDTAPSSVTQVRECAASLLRYAKQSGVSVILIGHINKEGTLAGPKILEHIVDVVLQFEGDGSYMYRVLRSIKNRFGTTSELAIFEMRNTGLREVSNPSELLLTHREQPLSGIAVAATIDGVRPLLVEVQALVSSAVYGTPQRSTTGYDAKRLNMLLAVLEKRAAFKLGAKDVFINVAGGLRLTDPGADLAVVAAVLSSYFDVPFAAGCCFAGEVGLSGEIRQVSRLEQRIKESHRLGFNKVFISNNRLPQDFSLAGCIPMQGVVELVKGALQTR